MFDQVIETTVSSDGTTTSKRLISDEATLAEMEFLEAQVAFAYAEETRARLYAERGICEEYNAAIKRLYRYEIKFHALFCEGDESKRMKRMYCQYRERLLRHHKPEV